MDGAMSELPGRLARWNAELEYGITSDHTLFPLPGQPLCAVPFLMVSRYEGGYLLLFHEEVPPIVRQRLDELGEETVLEHPEKVLDVLSEMRIGGPPLLVSPYLEGGFFPAAPSPLSSPEVEERRGDLVVVREGKVVSRAWTVRENHWCAEGAVETSAELRRRGLGSQVLSAWARHMIASGRAAFYSFKRENEASKALARKLGVHPFATSRRYVRLPAQGR